MPALKSCPGILSMTKPPFSTPAMPWACADDFLFSFSGVLPIIKVVIANNTEPVTWNRTVNRYHDLGKQGVLIFNDLSPAKTYSIPETRVKTLVQRLSSKITNIGKCKRLVCNLTRYIWDSLPFENRSVE